MAGWVPSWEVQSRRATLSASIPEFSLLWLSCVEPFVRGWRCCNVLLLWQEKEWTPPHTHTQTQTYSLTSIQQECAWKKKKPRSCLLLITFFSALFFPLLACLETEGGDRKGGRETEGGETFVIGKRHHRLHAMGPPPFIFSLSMHTLGEKK